MADLFATLSPDGSPIYLANLPNAKGGGWTRHEYARNDAELQRFIANYDRPGRALYFTVAKLKDGASRSKANVQSVSWLWSEIDFKDHPTLASEEIRRRIEAMPHPPTMIVGSGHGFHLYWKLNEPADAAPGKAQQDVEDALKLACAYVGGDTSAAEAARLLRLPGSHNSKAGGNIAVAILADNNRRYEISDLVDFWLEAQPIMPTPAKGNGHDPHASDDFNIPPGDKDGPVDVEARLRDMQWQGPGKTAIHITQLQCVGALLRQGTALPDVTAQVLEATRRAVPTDTRCADWDWGKEERAIERMGTDLINKDSTLAPCLPGALWEKFQAAIEAGNIAKVSRNAFGLHVREYKAAKSDDDDTEQQSSHDRAEDSSAANDEQPRADNAGQKEQPKKSRRPELFVLRPFVPFDPAKLPPRQWLYGRHYLRQTVSATVAPGGYGKSTLDMIEGIALATCRNLLGEQPMERLRVWFHNGEEPLEEMDRRIAAVCQHYDIPQQELVGWFFRTSGHEVPLRVAEGYSKLEINNTLIARISDQIKQNGIDVAIFDPLITLHSVPETDNTKMDQVIRIFAGIADENKCATELSHHVRKGAVGSNRDYAAADIRGATAIHDAIRGARILNHMSDQDARELAIEEHHRARYFRVDKAKGNYSPATKAVWRQFISVEIANGDDVGVITTWDYPGHGEATPQRQEQDRKADFVFLQLLDRFEAEGRTVSDRVGPNYAPPRFAKESEAKLASLGSKVLEYAMRRLFRDKKIKATDEGSGGKAKHRISRAPQRENNSE